MPRPTRSPSARCWNLGFPRWLARRGPARFRSRGRGAAADQPGGRVAGSGGVPRRNQGSLPAQPSSPPGHHRAPAPPPEKTNPLYLSPRAGWAPHAGSRSTPCADKLTPGAGSAVPRRGHLFHRRAVQPLVPDRRVRGQRDRRGEPHPRSRYVCGAWPFLIALMAVAHHLSLSIPRAAPRAGASAALGADPHSRRHDPWESWTSPCSGTLGVVISRTYPGLGRGPAHPAAPRGCVVSRRPALQLVFSGPGALTGILAGIHAPAAPPPEHDHRDRLRLSPSPSLAGLQRPVDGGDLAWKSGRSCYGMGDCP